MKVAIYCRVSTLEQATDGYSLIAQEEKCKSYAKAMAYEIFDTYIDDGYSAKTLTRPALNKLLFDIKGGNVNTVIIYKLDRLSRSVKNVLELVELFDKYNVTLYSLSENLDLSSPFGRAALKMSATFSELERETIVERMMLGKMQRVKQGKAMRNNLLPIGYNYDEAKQMFIPHPEEKEQVIKIFELYLNGWTMAKVSAYMHKHYTNRYGSYNTRNAVYKVLANPFHAGYFWFKGTLYKANNIEPIISYETWLKAEAMRLNAKGQHFRPGSPYLLTGLLICGKCGSKYVSKKYEYTQQNKTGPKTYLRHCYGCQARVKRDAMYDKNKPKCDNEIIRQEEINKRVIKYIKTLKFTNFKHGAENGALALIQSQITELKAKNEKLLDVYLENKITKEQFAERTASIEKEIEQKQMLLKNESDKVAHGPQVDINKIKEKITHIEKLELYEQRLLLKTLIKQITIYPAKLIFEMNVA